MKKLGRVYMFRYDSVDHLVESKKGLNLFDMLNIRCVIPVNEKSFKNYEAEYGGLRNCLNSFGYASYTSVAFIDLDYDNTIEFNNMISSSITTTYHIIKERVVHQIREERLNKLIDR